MPLNRGVWLDDLGQYDCEEEVFGACAGGALYRRAALEAIRLPGGDIFDSRLWMYLEDVDLAWRLQLGGFCCVYAPGAVVHHHLSATAGGELASYFVSRNIWHILLHTMPRRLLRSSGRRKFAFHLGRVMRDARHARSPHARASLRGSLAGVGVAARALGPARNRDGCFPQPDPEQVHRIERLLARC
jgi:GT2 family glycosyltransferase